MRGTQTSVRPSFTALAWSGMVAFLVASLPVAAISSFGRQTGMQCAACHTVFPELTAFGRQFKLRGYTMGSALEDKSFPYNLPLALGLQAGETSVKDRYTGANAEEDFGKAGKPIVQQLAIYYAGKIVGNLGAMAQYNWDGIEGQWAAEMVDIRYADTATVKGTTFLYGVSVSNSPSVQDVWNTSSMWTFPYTEEAGIMPMVTPLLDMTLDNQIGAVNLYVQFAGQYYVEFGLFQNGHRGILRPLNNGSELETAIEGSAPHLRLAWERNWGPNSLEIGMQALWAHVYPDAEELNGPTDRYTDVAVDGQYQYGAGAHLVSVHAFYDHEQRDWNASFPMGMASNGSDNLNSLNLNVEYWYKRRVGGGLGYFDYSGDSDMLKYGMAMDAMPSAMGSASGSPDTRYWTAEVDWLPLKDQQNLKLGVRYTAYSQFNGASTNYNGFGRNASDNNAWFLYGWLLY